MNLGFNLNKLCKEKGLSLSKLAKEAGVPVQTVHAWTTGRNSINPDQARQVAKVLRVSVHYLLFSEADPYVFEAEEILEEIFKGDVRVTLERIKKRAKK